LPNAIQGIKDNHYYCHYRHYSNWKI